MFLFFMKMDTPSETSFSWVGIFSSALARYLSLENKISTMEASTRAKRERAQSALASYLESNYFRSVSLSTDNSDAEM